jgi:hypothetical protein
MLMVSSVPHRELLKLSQLLSCSLEIIVTSNEDQVLVLFQYLYLSIGAKMDFHGPGRLMVVRVMMGGKQGGYL